MDTLVRHRALALRSLRPLEDVDETEVRAILGALDRFDARARRLPPRIPKGFEGGGRFRSINDTIFKALAAWAKGEGPDNPFDDPDVKSLNLTREHYRKAAKARGITLRRGATEDEIKAALLDDMRAKGRPAKTADAPKKAPAKKAPAKKAAPGTAQDPAMKTRRKAVRDQHAKLQEALKTANAIADVDEVLGYEGSDDTLRHRVDALTRIYGSPESLRTELLAAIPDRDKVREVLDRHAAKAGISPIGAAGEPGRFTPTLHQSADGSPIRPGAPVQVVKRGFRHTADGDDTRLTKALVEEISEDEFNELSKDSTPAPAKATPAAKKTPPKKAARAPKERPPYLGPDNSVDLEKFGEHVDADIRRYLDPTRNPMPLAFAPVEEQFPYSYGLYLISDRLAMGKISTKKAVKELRDYADRVDRQVGFRTRDIEQARAGGYRVRPDDVASVEQGKELAPRLRKMADALEAAKIPPRKRGVTLAPTVPGEFVPVDESRFVSAPIKGGLIRHRGEAVPESFRHERNVRLASVAGKQIRPGLTLEESRALDNYTAVAVADKLNGSLRQGKNSHGTVKVPGVEGEIDLDEVRIGLDAALENSEVSQDTLLWRGVIARTTDIRRLEPGVIYRDAGYLSTTTDEEAARRIIRRRAQTETTSTKKPVIFKILAPAGTRAALGHEDVSEAVLPRGQEFRIVRRDDSGDIPVVVMEALPRGGLDPTYTPGHTLVETFDYPEVANLPGGSLGAREEGVGDQMLAAIQERQGFNGAPRVVESLDAAIEGGAIELFRGYRDNENGTAEQFAEDFRTGPLFPGLGTYGSGTYAGTVRSTAETYGTVVVRMALRRDAKVIRIDDLEKLHAKVQTSTGAAIDRAERAALQAVDPNDAEAIAAIRQRFDLQRERLGPKSRVVSDMGRYAALLGYDAIFVPAGYDKRKGAGNPAEYVVLNRTAVLVEEGP